MYFYYKKDNFRILKLSVLISIIFASGCKSDKHMSTDDLKAPSAEKQAKSLTIHNSTRIDNYFWMRLSDEQKTAKNKDAPVVCIYLITQP